MIPAARCGVEFKGGAEIETSHPGGQDPRHGDFRSKPNNDVPGSCEALLKVPVHLRPPRPNLINSVEPRRLPAKCLFLILIALLAVPRIAKADLLVVDRSKDGILRFDDAGNLLGTFVASGSGGLLQIASPVFGPDGNLYIPDQIAGLVNRYNGSTGAFMGTFVPKGAGGLIGPVSIAFGPDGNLYVADFNARVIRSYNGTTGVYIGVFTNGGNSAVINEWLALEGPTNLVFGPDSNLYVSDAYSIVQFNGTSGAFMSVFVPRSGGFIPAQLVFGADGDLYVGSELTGVRRYNGTTGAFINQFVPFNGSWALGGVAFGPDGNLYVGYSNGANFIGLYSGQTGAYIRNFVSSGVIGNLQGFVFTPGSAVPTAIQPTHGGNSGQVTATITGKGFQASTTVKLTGIGPDIIGTNTNLPYPSALTTTFDLTGATPGVRNVVVTNPDNTTTTLNGGFTVEQSGAPNVSVDIIGRNLTRLGLDQAYYIVVRNTGNVDAPTSRAWIAFPSTIVWDTPQQLPSTSGQMNNHGFLAFDINVAAGASVMIPIILTTKNDLSFSNQQFQVQVWRQ